MTALRRFFLLVLFGFGIGFAVPACDLSTVTPADAVGAAAGCPDVSSVSAVARVDWAKEFELDAQVAGRIKGGVTAALELKGFAASLDGELRVACTNLARDLGASGQWGNGPDACKAAISAMGALKAKMGGGARIALSVVPPRCSASMDAMADCVAKCDVNVEPGKAELTCEGGKLSGRCDAQCSGTCHLEAAARCEGTCQGSCSANFSGRCGGSCNGNCDGKAMSGGQCSGKCEGSCSASAQGTCGGQCQGSCRMSGAASCRGECEGSCSVQMKAPRCTGELRPPKASAECKASCDAKISAEVKCTPAQVALRIDGAVDAAAAAKYRAAIQKNLPAVLKIAVGMKDRSLKAAASVKTVIDGVQAAIGSLKGAGSAGARLAACVAAPFKAAFDAAASVQANVKVSVSVQASASASASASGGASAG